mmetsp:Transcript_105525/g.305208  ORF Transcript_105525/g.305208 Transcript_105525/m.305208 type:complete len:549 (+) Transcript_105525:175-1821(+)
MSAPSKKASQTGASAPATTTATTPQTNMAVPPAPFWGMPGMGNFYGMPSFAPPQEPPPMIAVAKLCPSTAHKATNSNLVIKSAIRKLDAQMQPYSVAEWARKAVEENPEWLLKLIQRQAPNEKVVTLVYGNGFATMVFLDDQISRMPQKQWSAIPKIPIGVSMAAIDSKIDEKKLAQEGILQPVDPIYDHVQFETTSKSNKCLMVHSAAYVWGESMDGRRHVLQVERSGPKYRPNPVFEQTVLDQWMVAEPTARAATVAPAVPNMMAMNMGRPAMMPNFGMAAATTATLPTAAMPTTQAVEEENVTVIEFNPKELILLEKAFDNRLTQRDLKSNVTKYSTEDKKACQEVIRRAQSEFVFRGPSRKRKPKTTTSEEEKKPAAKKAKKDSTTTEKKKEGGEKKTATPKTTTSEEEKKPAAKKAKKDSTTTEKKKEGGEKKTATPKKPAAAATTTTKKTTPAKKAKETPKASPAKKKPAAASKQHDEEEPISNLVASASKDAKKKSRRSSAANKKPAATPKSKAKEPAKKKTPKESSTKKRERAAKSKGKK